MDLQFVKQLRELYTASFADSQAYVDSFFAEVNQENTVALVSEKGEVESALYLIDKTLCFSGVSFLSPFIVAAATQPHLRRQGKMETVMLAAFSRLKERGVCFTALYPDVKGFYEKFGFINFTYTDKHIIVPKGESAKSVTADSEILLSLYNEFCIGKNAYAVRNLQSFDSMAEKLKIDGGAFNVYELEGRMCYVSLDDGNIMEACGDYNVLSHVKQLHGKTLNVFCGKTPYGMLRLINPLKALKDFHYDFDGCLSFYLTDSFFPQNDGCYTVEVKHNKAEVFYEKQGSCDAVVTIEELTESLSGVCSGGVLKNLIEKKQNICFDKY